VKLYNFGKCFKVEIDDKMPFNKFDEIQTAKCELLEELWPAILTKAIIKFFRYKFTNKNSIYDEIGDLHIIYALTGYQGERIFLKNPKENGKIILNKNNISNRNQIKLKQIENDTYQNDSINNINKNTQDSNFSILNKYFDSNDSFKNKISEEKLKAVLKNVLRDENYKMKKTFMLNFNTLNMYSEKRKETLEDEMLLRDNKRTNNFDVIPSLTQKILNSQRKNKPGRNSRTNLINVPNSNSNKKNNQILHSQMELEKYERMRKLQFMKNSKILDLE